MVPEPARGMPEPVIRVLVVDDHPLVREGIRFCLQSQPDLEVAGEAEGCDQALAILDEERVDVVLLDMRMPGIGGDRKSTRLNSSH